MRMGTQSSNGCKISGDAYWLNNLCCLVSKPLVVTHLLNKCTRTDCPGTESQQAGKVSACQGCPNQSVCAAGLPRGPDPGRVSA